MSSGDCSKHGMASKSHKWLSSIADNINCSKMATKSRSNHSSLRINKNKPTSRKSSDFYTPKTCGKLLQDPYAYFAQKSSTSAPKQLKNRIIMPPKEWINGYCSSPESSGDSYSKVKPSTNDSSKCLLRSTRKSISNKTKHLRSDLMNCSDESIKMKHSMSVGQDNKESNGASFCSVKNKRPSKQSSINESEHISLQGSVEKLHCKAIEEVSFCNTSWMNSRSDEVTQVQEALNEMLRKMKKCSNKSNDSFSDKNLLHISVKEGTGLSNNETREEVDGKSNLLPSNEKNDEFQIKAFDDVTINNVLNKQVSCQSDEINSSVANLITRAFTSVFENQLSIALKRHESTTPTSIVRSLVSTLNNLQYFYGKENVEDLVMEGVKCKLEESPGSLKPLTSLLKDKSNGYNKFQSYQFASKSDVRGPGWKGKQDGFDKPLKLNRSSSHLQINGSSNDNASIDRTTYSWSKNHHFDHEVGTSEDSQVVFEQVKPRGKSYTPGRSSCTDYLGFITERCPVAPSKHSVLYANLDKSSTNYLVSKEPPGGDSIVPNDTDSNIPEKASTGDKIISDECLYIADLKDGSVDSFNIRNVKYPPRCSKLLSSENMSTSVFPVNEGDPHYCNSVNENKFSWDSHCFSVLNESCEKIQYSGKNSHRCFNWNTGKNKTRYVGSNSKYHGCDFSQRCKTGIPILDFPIHGKHWTNKRYFSPYLAPGHYDVPTVPCDGLVTNNESSTKIKGGKSTFTDNNEINETENLLQALKIDEQKETLWKSAFGALVLLQAGLKKKHKIKETVKTKENTSLSTSRSEKSKITLKTTEWLKKSFEKNLCVNEEVLNRENDMKSSAPRLKVSPGLSGHKKNLPQKRKRYQTCDNSEWTSSDEEDVYCTYHRKNGEEKRPFPEFEACVEILTKIWNSNLSSCFKREVKVDSGMGRKTSKHLLLDNIVLRLNNGVYKSAVQFVQDMKGIFQKIKDSDEEQIPFRRSAEVLEHEFNALLLQKLPYQKLKSVFESKNSLKCQA